MHLKTRTWVLISVLCFILAGYFWHLGNERWRRDMRSHPESPGTATSNLAPHVSRPTPDSVPIKELGTANFHHSSPPLLAPTNATNVARSNPLLTNRLSNTSVPLKDLMRNDNAVLLRNAFI